MRFRAVISQELLTILHAQAIESHPLEVTGYFVGIESNKKGVTVFDIRHLMVSTRYRVRTPNRLDEIKGNVIGGWWDMLHEKDDKIFDRMERIGGWHTHPDGEPRLSMPSDITKWDRKNGISSDFDEIEDGKFELITAIWVGKRGKFLFKDAAFAKVGNRHFRCPITVW